MPDLAPVDQRLRAIFTPYRDRFSLRENEQGLIVELPGYEGQPWGYVAGTRLGKRYVSFYLMSVYAQPGLLDGISPGLRRRMQGKSCFNFTTVNEALLGELKALTARAIQGHADAVGPVLQRAKRR